jgi:hypothetical protein
MLTMAYIFFFKIDMNLSHRHVINCDNFLLLLIIIIIIMDYLLPLTYRMLDGDTDKKLHDHVGIHYTLTTEYT